MILHRAEAARASRPSSSSRVARRLSTYAIILGHLAARRAGDPAEAKAFLEGTPGKLDSMRGLIRSSSCCAVRSTSQRLSSGAVEHDEKTDARCFLGLDQLIQDHKDKALAHFRWVRDHGDPTSVLYVIALAELERLEKPEPKSPPGQLMPEPRRSEPLAWSRSQTLDSG